MYDEVLTLEFPVEVTTVGFADDDILWYMVYGESIEKVELTAAHSIAVVEEWIQETVVELAYHKTEVMVVNSRKPEQQAVISVRDCTLLYHFKARRHTPGDYYGQDYGR